MHAKSLLLIGFAAGLVASANAGEAFPSTKELFEPEPTGYGITHELSTEFSGVGSSDIGFNGVDGDISELHTEFDYRAVPQLSENFFLRLGVGHELFAFDLPNGIPLPNRLESVNAHVGFDMAFSENWFMRIEAAPGIYSDFSDVTGRDWNVPFTVGTKYVFSENFSLSLGARVDLWSEWPVIPGGGFTWKLNDLIELDMVAPRPRINFHVSEELTLYVGGELKGGSFRVSDQFGEGWDEGALNSALLSYREIRVGAGATWEFMPNMTVELEGGYLVDREFDYHKTNVDVNSEGAGYGKIALRAKF